MQHHALRGHDCTVDGRRSQGKGEHLLSNTIHSRMDADDHRCRSRHHADGIADELSQARLPGPRAPWAPGDAKRQAKSAGILPELSA